MIRSIEKSRIRRDGIPAGESAPDFTLRDLNGTEVRFDSFRGSYVILIFSLPNCAPCQDLIPLLEIFHRRTRLTRILVISRGEVEFHRAKTQEYGLTYPILLQHHWEISTLFGIFATPSAFLIDPRGINCRKVAVGTEHIFDLFREASHKVMLK